MLLFIVVFFCKVVLNDILASASYFDNVLELENALRFWKKKTLRRKT